MYILGINAYHGDASACLYRDGELIAATEEERIRRVKHWAGLPSEAIRFCLQEGGITLTEVDHITVSKKPFAKLTKKIGHTLQRLRSLHTLKDRVSNSGNIRSIKNDLVEALGADSTKTKAKVHHIEHHRSHMASGFYVSPFEDAALLSIDGMGDFSSTMRAVGSGGQIEVIDSVSYPHSLGFFYTALTQFLGFPKYGDEYKVMGLAPYGKALFVKELSNLVVLKDNGLFELNEKYFSHFKTGVKMSSEDGTPFVDPLFSESVSVLLGKPRIADEPLTQKYKDIAASVQLVCEETIFHMANDLYKKTGYKNLCITGGVGQNSVANGKVIQNTSFEKLFVPPAAHDAGTAMGSALYFYHHELKKPRNPFRHQVYTGMHFSEKEITQLLDNNNITFEIYSDEKLYDVATNCLIDGGVVGWFQGRAEFGPRALGNRSILVDPRRADAKELLNQKIKKRESFRPFAPSILKEYLAEYFEQTDEVPFMEKVFNIKKDKQQLIPAVTHVNGTGRLQTVSKEDNLRYHNLINTFHQKTNIPILLNTSFNENEPIVNTPKNALDCYLRTKMDMLVLGNIVINR